MEHGKIEAVNHCIREVAQQATTPSGLSALLIERFLCTADETWDGAGSGQYTPAQFKNDGVYRHVAKDAMRTLFQLLANLLPAEAHVELQVASETLRGWLDPMVKGLVQRDWHIQRTFVLNLPGAKAAMEAELSSCDMGSAWRIP